jgi:hypothetical protein
MKAMLTRANKIGSILILLVVLSTACNFPFADAGQGDLDVEGTASEQTLAAQLTSVAETLAITLAVPSSSPTPTITTTPTTGPTSTRTPTATATPKPCDSARFISDVTIPDNSRISPGVRFIKTWRLQNNGTCTWTSDYELVFMEGDRMSGPSAVSLGTTVDPGESVDISVSLTAPGTVGEYRGYWALRNTSNRIFGIGGDAAGSFWVDIEVYRPKELVYSLTDDYCDAEWRSDAGILSCPGSTSDSEGFVIRMDNPDMEGGRVEDEPGLWMEPEWVDDGWIMGTFPPYEVQEGDRFRALVSCRDSSPECDVVFRLEYQIGTGTPRLLGEWHEVSEGDFSTVDVDLSHLEGSKIKFILTVFAGDTYSQDSAVWINPSVWN